eukprot:TRINITY_DN791_c0_g1_i1.p1 TRINITY_DN791_c0_g1~~TRINITY_DN791_c0_g1_i1.p1  ORF type:complete len:171 (+),score=19.22 TRINITY_DN791_c0_g1_i1:298-810(+)
MEGSVVGEYDLPIDACIKDLRQAIHLHLKWHVTFLDAGGEDVLDTILLAMHAVLTVRQMDREVYSQVCPTTTLDTKSPDDISTRYTPGCDDAHAAAFDFKKYMNNAASEHQLLRRAERLETKRRSLAVKSGDPSGPWSKSVKQSLRMHKQNGPRRCQFSALDEHAHLGSA